MFRSFKDAEAYIGQKGKDISFYLPITHIEGILFINVTEWLPERTEEREKHGDVAAAYCDQPVIIMPLPAEHKLQRPSKQTLSHLRFKSVSTGLAV